MGLTCTSGNIDERYDTTPPTINGNITASGLSPTSTLVDWSSTTFSDSCSAIAQIQVAIGSASGGNDILDWVPLPVSVGAATSYQFNHGVDGVSLQLTLSTSYFTSLRVVDSSGNQSSETTSAAWIVPLQALSQTDAALDGVNNCFLAGQSFDCLVDNTTDGGGWVLIGRGREGWDWSDGGRGAPGGVIIDLAGGGGGASGTVGATTFSPTYWSSSIIQSLLDNGGLTVRQTEVWIKRAANSSGSSYQDVRWNIDRTTWSWLLDTSFSFASPVTINGVNYTTMTSVNTRDSNYSVNGNDASRIFTWAWSSHGFFEGFSYGSSILFGGNSPTNFGWEFASENHTIPYTEVYIRQIP